MELTGRLRRCRVWWHTQEARGILHLYLELLVRGQVEELPPQDDSVLRELFRDAGVFDVEKADLEKGAAEGKQEVILCRGVTGLGDIEDGDGLERHGGKQTSIYMYLYPNYRMKPSRSLRFVYLVNLAIRGADHAVSQHVADRLVL